MNVNDYSDIRFPVANLKRYCRGNRFIIEEIGEIDLPHLYFS